MLAQIKRHNDKFFELSFGWADKNTGNYDRTEWTELVSSIELARQRCETNRVLHVSVIFPDGSQTVIMRNNKWDRIIQQFEDQNEA